MMDIRIYQINLDCDKDRVAFEGLDRLPSCQGSSEPSSPGPNAGIYDKIYEGSVECSNLESVYEMFNRNHPAEYRDGFSICADCGVPLVDVLLPEHANTLHIQKPPQFRLETMMEDGISIAIGFGRDK